MSEERVERLLAEVHDDFGMIRVLEVADYRFLESCRNHHGLRRADAQRAPQTFPLLAALRHTRSTVKNNHSA